MASFSLADEYPREIFKGMMKYAHENQRFAIRFHDQDRHSLEDLVEYCKSKAAVGIVVYGSNLPVLKTAREINLPCVNVSNSHPIFDMPSVLVDNEEVGWTAASHLLRKGYTAQVFIHMKGLEFSTKRMMGWQKRLKESGVMGKEIVWESFHQTMEILEDLPKPLAITAATDHMARSLLDRCLNVGWSVPNQVAVLGCGNNELICDGGLVSLSSVPLHGVTVGAAASKVLIDMIDGAPPPTEPILIDPGEVMERESTDLISQAEPTIADAIRFIRTHACTGIQIEDVLQVTNLSRATLDRQVKKVLGHSPHSEIKKLQIERARHLLANTHAPLAEISMQCGYKEPNYFMRVFREEVGLTPTEFRRDIVAKSGDTQ
ncbi:MAG: helix-turn-helix domain-containing protein [Kiritimatiellae bacterium]|nr:helix-turn-helix domain-containing protein [Kiritimatiellia bacterium]